MLTDWILVDDGFEDAEAVVVYREDCEKTVGYSFILQHDHAGKCLCAILSSIARILAVNQLLRSGDLHLSASFWYRITDGIYTSLDLLKDGNLITARGLGGVPFARQIIGKLHEKKAFSYA